MVPFIPGTSEKFKKLCKNKGIQVHYKGTNTLRTLLGNPKDKDPKINQSGIIYHYKCPQINCPSAYIGESGRSLGDRVKEHFKVPSPIHLHSTTTGHPMDPEQFKIVHKEVNSHSRIIKEAMFICIQDPTLNRNLGKYQLPHIWDHLLQVSPTLQLKPSSLPYPVPDFNYHIGTHFDDIDLRNTMSPLIMLSALHYTHNNVNGITRHQYIWNHVMLIYTHPIST